MRELIASLERQSRLATETYDLQALLAEHSYALDRAIELAGTAFKFAAHQIESGMWENNERSRSSESLKRAS